MIISYILTHLCQEKNCTLKELVNKQPQISRLLIDPDFHYRIWIKYKNEHSDQDGKNYNPQTLRNQCDFMRYLIGFLISHESEAAIINKLYEIKKFWTDQGRKYSFEANYYRNTQRTKLNLQKQNKYLFKEEMKEMNIKAQELLDYIINKQENQVCKVDRLNFLKGLLWMIGAGLAWPRNATLANLELNKSIVQCDGKFINFFNFFFIFLYLKKYKYIYIYIFFFKFFFLN